MNRLILCVIVTNHLLGLQDMSCSTSLFPALYPILSPMNPNSGEAGKLANGTSPVSSYSQLFRISFPICLLNHLWYIKLRSNKRAFSLSCMGASCIVLAFDVLYCESENKNIWNMQKDILQIYPLLQSSNRSKNKDAN